MPMEQVVLHHFSMLVYVWPVCGPEARGNIPPCLTNHFYIMQVDPLRSTASELLERVAGMYGTKWWGYKAPIGLNSLLQSSCSLSKCIHCILMPVKSLCSIFSMSLSASHSAELQTSQIRRLLEDHMVPLV